MIMDFIYSHPYDRAFYMARFADAPDKAPPFDHDGNRKTASAFVEALKSEWTPREEAVTRLIQETTGRPWTHKTIRCFVTNHAPSSFSYPLTLNTTSHGRLIAPHRAAVILAHELVHVNLSGAGSKSFGSEIFRPRYPDADPLVWNHIAVDAVLAKVLPATFGEKSIESERSIPHPSYKKAWEIVDTEGVDSIINLIRET